MIIRVLGHLTELRADSASVVNLHLVHLCFIDHTIHSLNSCLVLFNSIKTISPFLILLLYLLVTLRERTPNQKDIYTQSSKLT